MGYDIYIGETAMRPIDDEDAKWMIEEGHTPEHSRTSNDKTTYYEPYVGETEQDDAPVFPNDEMTGNSNNRHPSYTTWSHFCDVTGLTGVFFNKQDGLMREHPGLASIHLEHVQAIDQALQSWKVNHPNAVPGFDEWNHKTMHHTPTDNDPTLARLIWLDWWVKWAMNNCESPAIRNF